MRLAGGIAHGGAEVDEVLPVAILRPPGAKRIAQKVEFLVRVLTPPIVILAVDDLRLLRMQRQPTLGKPRSSTRFSHRACASLQQWHTR